MRKNDLLLFGAIVALALACTFIARTDQEGATAEVYADGQLIQTLSLQSDARYEWTRGDAQVVVLVQNGSVSVVQSTCPDCLCVRRGRISRAGESIVCLPNRFCVLLSSSGSVPDAVAY